jgi:hypothetical protein
MDLVVEMLTRDPYHAPALLFDMLDGLVDDAAAAYVAELEIRVRAEWPAGVARGFSYE